MKDTWVFDKQRVQEVEEEGSKQREVGWPFAGKQLGLFGVL